MRRANASGIKSGVRPHSCLPRARGALHIRHSSSKAAGADGSAAAAAAAAAALQSFRAISHQQQQQQQISEVQVMHNQSRFFQCGPVPVELT